MKLIPIIMLLIFIRFNTYASFADNRKLARKLGMAWCEFHKGRIFTYNQWISCPTERETLNQIQIPSQTLRIGNSTDYDYDCHLIAKADAGDYDLDPNCYSAFILNLLQERLKFKFSLVVSQSMGLSENATGLIGLLYRGQIDMIICHNGFLYNWGLAGDYLHTTLVSSRTFIFKPSKLPLTKDIFILTFPGSMWLCFFTATICLVITFRFSTWVHYKLQPQHEPWSWSEVVLWAISAICQQSYSRNPRGSSCRATFLIGYLITYLLFTAFSAGVTSLLAVQSQPPELNFKEILRMKLNVIFVKDSTHSSFLKNSPDEAGRAIYRLLVKKANREYKSLDEVFRWINEDRYIGLGSSISLRNYLWRNSHEKIENYVLSELVHSTYQQSFLIKKNQTELKELINYWLIKFWDNGLLQLGRRRFVAVPKLMTKDLGPGWSQADLGNVISSIFLLCGGMFFSMLILFCEMIWMRKRTSSVWELKSTQEIQNQIGMVFNKK